ncbi:hypothetical protein Dda_3369 [Drechslerella dactyloides]|uniref:Uncharacterized protein n=1 Tax=Drechslerella dactyloides TaxID=74499 RepID=A0AAD6J164_DREDA|nr:hypothetical protein Dda_3369 [Drechslerella dactyloides]
MASRPRSRTLATQDPSKRRSLPAGYDSGLAATGGVTAPEPAAASYISTRLSQPESTLHQYDNYKEQRLYNYVMSSPSASSASSPALHPSPRHARGGSISSQSENGNFFTNLFTVNPPSSSPHSRSQSMSSSQAAGASASAGAGANRDYGAGRRLSTFFGLGNMNDAASNSGLAFTASSPSSKRSVSNSTTMSKLVLLGGAGEVGQNLNQNPMTADEFAETDFAELLGEGVPKSPLNCTPQGFRNLHDKSIELIDRLYAGYLERSRALADALAEIEAMREEREQKDQKIESLRFSVEQLANVQETIAKASEEAERTAERANAEVKKLRAENTKLQWEAKSAREVELDDADSLSSRFGVRGSSSKQASEGLAPIMRPRTKSSNSDSGFESESDSGSVFSHDLTTKGGAEMISPSIAVADEDRYETDAASVHSTGTGAGTGTGSGPLAQLRNVLRRTTTMDTRCDCGVMINRLKSENGSLVSRVRELEGCLDSCLDLVAGV